MVGENIVKLRALSSPIAKHLFSGHQLMCPPYIDTEDLTLLFPDILGQTGLLLERPLSLLQLSQIYFELLIFLF